MSALAQPPDLYSSPVQKTELQVMRNISTVTSAGSELEQGLEAIAASVLQLQSIVRIRIEPIPGVVQPLVSAEWGHPGAHPRGTATAEIESSGCSWGRLKIDFDLPPNGIENPLRFTRFAAGQIARWLNERELSARRDALRRRVERLRERLATRKRVQRAMGILVQTRNLSEAEALLLLVKYSRESRRSLSQVAEAIILSEQDTWLRPPVLRHLNANEATGDLRNTGQVPYQHGASHRNSASSPLLHRFARS
jgi:ANTAR domain